MLECRAMQNGREYIHVLKVQVDEVTKKIRLRKDICRSVFLLVDILRHPLDDTTTVQHFRRSVIAKERVP